MAGSSAPLPLDAAGKPPHPKRAKRRPPASGKRRTSAAWDHFTEVPDSEVTNATAACNYCGKRYCSNTKKDGTSNMNSHLRICTKYPYALLNDPKQTLLNFVPKKDGSGSTMIAPQLYSLEEVRKALAVFVIVDEQPFKIIEGVGFRNFCAKLQPQFHVPSRITLARDCYQMYLDEKIKLKAYLSSNCARVCITTDCWTSLQNLNYMTVTAHFVDKEWTLQKRILSFSLIPNHKGDTIGKHIESCLNEWSLHKLFTVTVDNASSNDVAISYLRKRLNTTNLVMNGEFLHMRCCAHIFNLVVNEGLKDLHVSISSIRNAVRYVRSSPSRLAKFRVCVDNAHIECKRMVCLDVPTRWNSTYLMLVAAEKFQKAFEILEDDDPNFRDHFDEKTLGPPTSVDWSNARSFIKFLKIFYDVTVALSGSLYVTSNIAYHQVAMIQSALIDLSKSQDPMLGYMASDMKKKFDKYWGNGANMNPLLFIASVLDPRYKLIFIKWAFNEIYEDPILSYDLAQKVRDQLTRIYEYYSVMYSKPTETTLDECSNVGSSGGQEASQLSSFQSKAAAFKSHLRVLNRMDAKNELEKYLNEACIEEDDTFSVLGWWKTNAFRFPILSHIARDVLAIPVSTVASESAFSTSGRVLDVFRSSLSPKTVEMLICCQNWLKLTLFGYENFEFNGQEDEIYEKLESEVAAAGNMTHVAGGVAGAVEGQGTQKQPMTFD